MKIPATLPGSAPYFHGPPVNGMEMNPQWQGNGVMLEGGPPGNGGPYMVPHHVHPAGYAPPSGYYGPPGQAPAQPQDFSEYMWMENEEEFDKQVMQQLEEEALMEQCIEAMLADEREAQGRGDVSLEEQVSKSTLNPLAAEFVPTFLPAAAASVTETEIPTASSTSLSSENAASEEPEKSVAQVTEILSQVSLSKSEEAPVPEKETEAPSVEVPEPKPTPQVATENVKKVDAKDSKVAKVIEAAAAAVVVVSAIDGAVKDDKSSRTEKGKSAERKVELERKKSAESTKKETVKKTDSKESVKKSDSKESVKKVAAVVSEPVKRASVGKVERGPRPEKQKVVAEVKKKPEEVVVDLQGPPLPSVPAVPAAVAAEAEKPQPAVFNYAAAARANLPPKQPSAAPTSAPPPKEPAPAAPAAPKPEAGGKEARNATAAKTKPAEKGGVKSDDKRPFKAAGGPVKKGKK